MRQDPRVRSDVGDGAPLRDQEPASHATTFFSNPPKVSQVAQTLSEYVGGPVSVELAFDLVLNDVVEQARAATGATGAAVALFRDGELACRATAGENAPDLGVKVDSRSELAGSCISTGQMQQCRDTETDPRVNAEACRRLGVRSMLIAPLQDGQRIIGIMQVFSAWPNAFGNREISALQVLAGRIAESRREAESVNAAPVAEMPLPVSPPPDEYRTPPEHSKQSQEALEPETHERQSPDLWTTVLVVLVIAVAVALGVMIGWHRAARATALSQARSAAETNAARSVGEPQQTLSPTETVPSDEAKKNSPPASANADTAAPPPANAVIPNGGLVVRENGKVIYRSPAPMQQAVTKNRTQRSLLHKVAPEYPEEARAQHIQGAVVLDVQVLGSGAVGNINVISGDPLLVPAAMAAVRQWRYQPERMNGQEVESQTRITVKFMLPAS